VTERHPTGDPSDLRRARGKRVLVTGTDQPLGAAVAAALAHHGADLVTPRRLDLADLSSVRRAAAEVSRHGALDLLVNAAEVRGAPYQRTNDGFEVHLGANHLGHFALTGLLLPVLVASGAARVVTVSSLAHRVARRAPLGDPRAERPRYNRWQAYASSKLANLLFTFELDRLSRGFDLPLTAMAAHPGVLRGSARPTDILTAALAAAGQSAAHGSWPVLMAATAELPGATCVGPGGVTETQGPPRVVATSRLAHDPSAARALWELSQQATGVVYP
jgi:NAD(P)-dependent dehydrogenase (short-subunit alcohol dehydrogenase family)